MPSSPPSFDNQRFPQPLAKILEDLNLSSQDLVNASSEQLTYKQVNKVLKGKPVTANIQGKILRALKACAGDRECGVVCWVLPT